MAFRKVNEFKELTLVYALTGTGTPTATLQFFTDMPASSPPGTLAARLGAGVTLAATTGRKSITIPLDGIRGTEFYPSITPSSTAQVEIYSGVVYLRPLGVYVDGANSEIWQTVPIAPGVGGGGQG